jgi:regulatory protein
MTSPPNDRPCLQAAVKLLAARDYSEQELRQRLTAAGYPAPAVDPAIADLTRRHYLDDAALCMRLAAKYQAAAKYGVNAIAARLKQRGLPQDLIQAALAGYDRAADTTRALELVQRRFPVPHAVPAGKIGRFLAGRGFAAGTIDEVLRQVCDELNDNGH